MAAPVLKKLTSFKREDYEKERIVWEKAEARELVHNRKNRQLVNAVLLASDKYYGEGSSARIVAHMRQIMIEELLKKPKEKAMQ